MNELLSALDIMVMEQRDDGSFKLMGKAPDWSDQVLPQLRHDDGILESFEKYSFLDNFSADAEQFWAENDKGRLKSGPFTQNIQSKGEFSFEASALCLNNKKLLLVELLGDYFEDQKKLFQRARENLLVREYLEEQVRLRTKEIRQREEEIVHHLVWAAEFRDNDTGSHIRRIGLYSEAMAKELGWSLQASDDIRIAAPMHDIGKIGIPDRILLKNGKLTADEWKVMCTHTSIGAQILGSSKIALLQMAREIAQNHHEKWDGSGYPNGLVGENIPQSARIVAIADVYDALLSERSYKPPMTIEETLSIIKIGKGRHFDPGIYDVFMDLLPELNQIRRELQAE